MAFTKNPDVKLDFFTVESVEQAGGWLARHSKDCKGFLVEMNLYIGMGSSGPVGYPYCEHCGKTGARLERRSL